MNILWNTNILMASEQTSRVFGLDLQLVVDALIVACAVLFLFFILSYLVFNPARDLLKKRQEKVKADLDDAAREKEEATAFKEDYEARLANASADVDRIIAEGRKRAIAHEEEIVAEANAEAKRILERTERESQLEKARVKDEVKQDMIDIAQAMAGKFISEKMNESEQNALVDEAIREMGETTWQ